jgi:Tol biopolymer transport system component
MTFYDVQTGTHMPHGNKELYNFFNLSWTPDGRWIVGSVFAGMGYGQAILAVEAGGRRIATLHEKVASDEGDLFVCRPDVSHDGRWIAWAGADRNKVAWIDVVGLDLAADPPRLGEVRHVVEDYVPIELYHPDFSPDGRFVAFSRGVRGNRMKPPRPVIGEQAPTWNICVVDTENPGVFVEITRDGLSNKEPDWIPTR